MRHNYASRDALTAGFANWCLERMQSAVKKHGDARVLLSGGGTPGPTYEKMNAECPVLDSVLFGLVDERFVDQKSDFSNERLIRNCFPHAPQANIEGMVFDLNDSTQNIKMLAVKYAHFVKRTDLVILGMGSDGHTASIFPNDAASERALTSSDSFLNTNAPAHPTQRITCSLDLLKNAASIALLITGAQKLEVLESSDLKLPIHEVLQACPNIQIFYTE